MRDFVQGWGLTIVMLAAIALVFVAAWAHLATELRWVRALTDYLGSELVGGQDKSPHKASGSLTLEALRDEVNAVVVSSDPVWAQRQVRSWEMRAQRLEPAQVFWIDLLRSLGLLGTVLGLGMSMTLSGSDVAKLLDPLALAVWTTVAGLALSIVLSALYGMKLTVWSDACAKNLEAWDRRRRQDREPTP
ncbi:MAG: MotA/TolQ/ExbB proton channel family protein [Myxococcales bacterium]|jgi:biopolymer transport protein ExbB/TolQ|nr:MotA/TolQ/ExbB proton channel family protein [Myxococcales bacterium]